MSVLVTGMHDALKLFLELGYFYVHWSGMFFTGYTGTNYDWCYFYLHTHSQIHTPAKLLSVNL